MKFKRGQKVFDKKREISGIIMNEIYGDIHVEYKKFKGDEDPFYISYTNDTDELSIIFDEKVSQSKYIISKDYLTIGKLKEKINKSNLPDNAPVLVEMVAPKEKWEQHQHKIGEGTADECTVIQAWSANSSKNDDFIMIWINY